MNSENEPQEEKKWMGEVGFIKFCSANGVVLQYLPEEMARIGLDGQVRPGVPVTIIMVRPYGIFKQDSIIPMDELESGQVGYWRAAVAKVVTEAIEEGKRLMESDAAMMAVIAEAFERAAQHDCGNPNCPIHGGNITHEAPPNIDPRMN